MYLHVRHRRLYHFQWLQNRDGWFQRIQSQYVEQIARRNVADGMLYVLVWWCKEEEVQMLRQGLVEMVEYEVTFGRDDGSDDSESVAAILVTNIRNAPSGFWTGEYL